MPLGWIDFSQKDRNLILGVLESLTEKKAVDELGVASIRDGFANLFFPGTSTLQTRAKYFLIVPYALKDLEEFIKANKNLSSQKVFLKLHDIEKSCCIKFLENNKDENGVLGKLALSQYGWLKRTPADIYIGGLNKFKILENISLREYINELIYNEKLKVKNNISEVGKYEADARYERDDEDTILNSNLFKLDIKTYDKNWKGNLKIELTKEEGKFLKNKIITSVNDSLFAKILEKNILLNDFDNFESLKKVIREFPQQIQDDYKLAYEFSDFWFVVQNLYNDIVLDGKNLEIKDFLNNNIFEFKVIAEKIDIEKIFERLNLITKGSLYFFLMDVQNYMRKGDFKSIKDRIKAREIAIKGEKRAKVNHIGEYEYDKLFSGSKLGYRFINAKNIIQDIFYSENL